MDWLPSDLMKRGGAMFRADKADEIEAALEERQIARRLARKAERALTPGPKPQFRGSLTSAIKAEGAHAYANRLLKEYNAHLDALHAELEKQLENNNNKLTYEEIQEEVVRARAAFGVPSKAHTRA